MITSLLEYKKDFLDCWIRTRNQQSAFLENLSKEVKLICSHSKFKVKSYYVVDDPSILNFPCETLSKFPTLSDLLKFVNQEFSSNLNSCVVNCYDSNSRGQPHADNESYVDQSQPICTFTMGSPRDVYFYESPTAGSPKLSVVQQIRPEEGSVYVMHKSFQSLFRHQVQPGEGARLSISFRRVIKSQPNPNEWPYLSSNGIGSSASSDGNQLIAQSNALSHEPLQSNNPTPPSESPQSDDSSHEALQSNNPPPRSEPPQSNTLLPPGQSNSPVLHTDTESSNPSSQLPDHDLDELMKVVDKLSNEECKKLIVLLNNKISEAEQLQFKLKEDEVDNLVKLIEKPLDDSNLEPDDKSELVQKVIQELASLEISKVTENVSTCWLLENPGATPFLTGQTFENFPGIKQLLHVVKSTDSSASGLNSCLISHYPNGKVKTRLHSDNSAFICDSTPICNFSIGESRDIAFYNSKLHSSPPLKRFTMNSQSLVIMHPGCQEKLKHVVLPDPNVSGNRFCISFRKVVPISSVEPEEPINPPATILIGTSITKRIDPAKLVGKATAKFINCSTSGDFIRNASDKVDKLYAGSLTDYQDKPVEKNLNIQNVIFSIGTNDIRRKGNGVSSLYYPLKSLLSKTRRLFPAAKLYLQSVIPMGFEFKWTPGNVLDFNDLQRRCAREISNCSYIDVQDEFLDSRRKYPVRSLYHDTIHPSPKGCAILARAFIRISRNRNFDLKL